MKQAPSLPKWPHFFLEVSGLCHCTFFSGTLGATALLCLHHTTLVQNPDIWSFFLPDWFCGRSLVRNNRAPKVSECVRAFYKGNMIVHWLCIHGGGGRERTHTPRFVKPRYSMDEGVLTLRHKTYHYWRSPNILIIFLHTPEYLTISRNSSKFSSCKKFSLQIF